MVSLFRVPSVRPCEALLTLIGNLFFPGLATAVLGLVTADTNTIIIGLVQFLATFLFFIGWLWALIFSILLLAKSSGSARRRDRGRAASSRAHGGRAHRAKPDRAERELIAERAARKAVAAVREPAPVARRSRTRAADCHYCRDRDAARRHRRHRHRR